jgi:hypothetical protein
MASDQLNTTTDSSTAQQNANSPQAAGQANNSSTLAPPTSSPQSGSAIQPSTTTSLLDNRLPANLSVQTPGAVTLSVPTYSTTKTATITTKNHAVSAPLLGISAGLLVVAILLFWIVNRAAKKDNLN